MFFFVLLINFEKFTTWVWQSVCQRNGEMFRNAVVFGFKMLNISEMCE